MFVKPDGVSDGYVSVSTALHREDCRCRKSYRSLVLRDGTGRTEHSLLACDRIPMAYLRDMYRAYAGTSDREKVGTVPGVRGTLGAVSTMEVPLLIDPDEWLTTGEPFPCVKAYEYRADRPGNRRSLEIFLARPDRSASYYALGRDGTMLVSTQDENETMQFGRETIDMLLRESFEYCHRPSVWRVDWSPAICRA